MASGSSKGFDFASDDILCSYEDYANQENNNTSHSDSAIASNSAKEFHKNRMARTSVFPNSSYSPPDDSSSQEVILLAVERSMKKHTDNLMRFLEGLSSRLSQLELYCYNLDKSIGEMRSDLTRDHGESEVKLKFLEKHLQEVHRSVQILRDKQELADTQKELAKLQLAQKDSSSSHNSQQNEERSSTPDAKKNDNSADSTGQQLALALPSQVAPPPPAAPQQQMCRSNQAAAATAPTNIMQSQVPPPQPQQQQQPPPQVHSLPQYQQQWGQQVQPQPSMQPGSRLHHLRFTSYLRVSHLNHLQMYAMQMPILVIPPPGSSQPMAYSYGGPVRTPQPQPPPQQQPPPPPSQHLKPAFGGPPGDGYAPAGGPPMWQASGGSGMMSRPGPGPAPPGQFMRNNPYNELIDKLVSMGYRGDHVMSVIQRLEETGQTVDFNAVLDRLNGHPSGGTQRGWSG
ncbi:putative callose synthase 12-like protein [Tanacetum coccineum]